VSGQATNRFGRKWLFLVGGGALGLGFGIIVSVTTEVPFAPEIGLVVGLAVAWIVSRSTA
jgi:hypothetical protein